MKNRHIILWILFLMLLPQTVCAAGELRRYLLAVGANSGGQGRIPLKYAVSDAERFADIMVRMGGIDSADQIVLLQPDRNAIETVLADLGGRISENPIPAGRTEILFYYSGHADESGLRIGNDHISYRDLRARIEAIPAAVRITVLDACASGAITRLKGSTRRQPFLVDASSDTKGYAFLTSSSANEAAQESDVIGASFFTHYFVSGLRGAADVSGDGRISLIEAYQFAFNETLARTTETMGGAQHPAYHINLSGTGDVVMTDVRRTSAGLVLSKELHGRFYIRDQEEHLLAELYKPRGRAITLGLEAGAYQIHLDRDTDLFMARIELGLEEVLVLMPEHFENTDRLPTTVRGGTGMWPPRPGFMGPLVGRHRIRLIVGRHNEGMGGNITQSGTVTTSVETKNLLLGLGYSRWIREDISIGLDLLVMEGDVSTNVGSSVSTYAEGLIFLRIGMRKYFPSSTFRTPIRPFALMGFGALLGSEDETSTGPPVSVSTKSFGAFGSEFGLGIDFILARWLMLGSKVSYSLATDFAEPIGGKDNYSSLEFGVSISWLFGKGIEQ